MDGPEISTELREIILSGSCVAFVGSGLSAGSYDSWPDLINRLCDRCGIATRVDWDSSADCLLDAAQAAKDANQGAYFGCLGEHFGRVVAAQMIYDAILLLPFKCYLTVNFDPLLFLKSRTAPRKCGSTCAYPALDRLKMNDRSIHYLHGLIEEKKVPVDGTIVLARDEFTLAYEDNGPLKNMLVGTLDNDAVVFIGCRLREPVMKHVFGICGRHRRTRSELALRAGGRHSDPPQRFIFLPTSPPKVLAGSGLDAEEEMRRQIAEEEARFKELEITPVWYPAPAADHSSLRHAFEVLADIKTISPTYGWD